jgi:hypothetical protein
VDFVLRECGVLIDTTTGCANSSFNVVSSNGVQTERKNVDISKVLSILIQSCRPFCICPTNLSGDCFRWIELGKMDDRRVENRQETDDR